MTNPHKGDCPLVIGERKFTLRYSHAALVKLEDQLGKGLIKVMEEMGNPDQMRIRTVVSLLWAGLQKHHPGVTFDEAADMLDEIGTQRAIEAVDEAFSRAFNVSGTKGTNPTIAGNGIGMPDLSSTSASGTATWMPSGTLPRES